MRGWLLCRMAGLDVEAKLLENDDPDTRAELLLLAPSFRVPCLRVEERRSISAEIWIQARRLTRFCSQKAMTG